MKHFVVAMVQHRSAPKEMEANTKLALAYISEAKAAGADFVLFPECFLTGYYFPEICKSLQPVADIENHPEFLEWCNNALEGSSVYLERIREMAAQCSIGVAMGCFTKGKRYPQNTALIFGKRGEILLKYSKVHTCDFSLERYLEPGEAFRVCRFGGISIGLMICYDREYPESARELMLQGAELILVPNDCADMRPFRLRELSVEAMQNMVGIAMANPPGKNAGSSCAYSPVVWGQEDNKIIVAEEERRGLVYAAFDVDAIREYRAVEDMGKYRKAAAYRNLIL